MRVRFPLSALTLRGFMFLIAKIIGARGVRGHLKVQTFTQDPFFLAQCPEVWDEQGVRKFVFSKVGWARMPDVVELKCLDIHSKEAADGLRGVTLYTAQKYLAPLHEEEYYWQELVGYTIHYQDSVMGTVLRVDNFGTQSDLIEIQCLPSGACVYVPFHKDFIQSVDRKTQKLWCTQAAAEWIQNEGR